ncbi:MAG TPA: hypothetical protein VMW53_02540, partial [archaeon]|nr:hypothetical protein [archaeon]
IEPRLVQPGQMVTVTAEAANFGTIRDSDTAILKINSKVVDTQELLLDRGETVKLLFSVNRSKPGTYRVELNECTGTFKVTGKSGYPPGAAGRNWRSHQGSRSPKPGSGRATSGRDST